MTTDGEEAIASSPQSSHCDFLTNPDTANKLLRMVEVLLPRSQSAVSCVLAQLWRTNNPQRDLR